jgi:hypothetical protein
VFHSIGRGRDESIRLGGSYKVDGLEVARYSQQIPKHDTTLALVFQGVDIQAAAAKPEMLHAMSIWRVSRPQWSPCENESICLARNRTAPGIPGWRRRKNLKNVV